MEGKGPPPGSGASGRGPAQVSRPDGDFPWHFRSLQAGSALALAWLGHFIAVHTAGDKTKKWALQAYLSTVLPSSAHPHFPWSPVGQRPGRAPLLSSSGVLGAAELQLRPASPYPLSPWWPRRKEPCGYSPGGLWASPIQLSQTLWPGVSAPCRVLVRVSRHIGQAIKAHLGRCSSPRL